MPPPPKKSLWVIYDGPQQFGATRQKYVATDGTVTDVKTRAARFETAAAAQEFVKAKSIALSEIRYIGTEDFTDAELQGG